MNSEQMARTDRLLFDHCLVHGRRVYDAEAPVSVSLPRATAVPLAAGVRTLWRALQQSRGRYALPPFPLRDLIQSEPFLGRWFWARADLCFAQNGDPFIAELNVDKPGAHREALSHPLQGAAFRRRFTRALLRVWASWRPFSLHGGAPPRAAVLVDPAHREELHLAQIYADLLNEVGWSCITVGPTNLRVEGQQALAFGEPINVLLRQFPTEFGHEVPAFADLFALQQAHRLLILNSPDALFAQAKSSFAWLWDQLIGGGGVLRRSEADWVRRIVPYTAPVARGTLPVDPRAPTGPNGPTAFRLLQCPEQWVLKPIFGRYSQGVVCGALASASQWGTTVATALAQPHYWIAQEYRPIGRQPVSRWRGGSPEADVGYVTWGLHLINGLPAAWIARCSLHPVTDDAWYAPVTIAGGEQRCRSGTPR